METPTPVLAPCPFCGGPPVASVFRGGTIVDADQIAAMRENDFSFIEALVWCHECGARGPSIDIDGRGHPEDAPHCAGRQEATPEGAEAMRLLAIVFWNERNARHIDLYVSTELHRRPKEFDYCDVYDMTDAEVAALKASRVGQSVTPEARHVG